MGIEHIAIWTPDIERLRLFYETYFDAKSNDKYINEAKGFQSYFLTFNDGSRIEIMNRIDITNRRNSDQHIGYGHLAMAFNTTFDVLRLTKRLEEDGYRIASQGRITGDGYFESVILDPDGNQIELVKKQRLVV